MWNIPKSSEVQSAKSKKEIIFMKCFKAVDMIASVWVTRSLEEEKGACCFKTQVLDVMAEAVSQKQLPERQI